MTSPTTAEDLEASLAALKVSFTRHSWYVLNLDTSALKPDAALLHAHLSWIKAREASGEIVATGLRFDADNKPVDGLTVLRAANRDQAQVIADSDPFAAAGAKVTLHRWDVAAGALSIAVTFSDRAVAIS